MRRGFFSGIFWGLLVIAAGGAMAALVYGPANDATKASRPNVDALEVPAGSEFQLIKPEEDAVVPQTDTTMAPVTTPESPAMATAGQIPSVPDAAPAHMPVFVTPDFGGNAGMVAPAVGSRNEIFATTIDAPILRQRKPAFPITRFEEFIPQADKTSWVQDIVEERAGEVAQDAEETQPDTEIAALPESDPPSVPVIKFEPEPQAEPEVVRPPVQRAQTTTPAVRVNRFPTIGSKTEPSEEEEKPEAGEEGAEPDADLGALLTYAMKFENPDAKPLLSVILIDNPDFQISDAALERLTFPLSFAIDAGRDDAESAAARYRSAGFEVLMLTNLPNGAKASDVEVAFEAYSKAMPEAVAVLDRGATPRVATQLAGIMADRGFGLITLSKGLNATQKAAVREGVPAALIYRELDKKGEKVSQIVQSLDRAGFRAAQGGSVILLGQTRAETLKALLKWTQGTGAARMAIAPVSAILIGQSAP